MHDRCACRLSEFGDQGLLALTKSIGVPTLQRIRRTATEPAETQSAELRNGTQTILGTRRQILRIVGGLLRMTDPVRARPPAQPAAAPSRCCVTSFCP